MRKDVEEGQRGDCGPLPYFRNYSTGFEDVTFWSWRSWRRLANLTSYQVTMLADLSHWNVTTAEASLNGPANRDLFEGMF